MKCLKSMKVNIIIRSSVFLFSILIFLSSYIFEKSATPVENIRLTFIKHQYQLDSSLMDLDIKCQILKRGDTSFIEKLKPSLMRCREKYKRLEFISEYYAPYLKINKPFLPEINERDNEIEHPQGFSVIENILYTRNVRQSIDELMHEIYILQLNVRALNTVSKMLESGNDSQLFESMRVEIVRITTLGITGYDTPDAQTCLTESAAALEGVRQALSMYYPLLDKGSQIKLDDAFEKTINYLTSNSDFEKFDRLEFIVSYLNPLSSIMLKTQTELNIPVYVSKTSIVNYNVEHIFDKNAFEKYFSVTKGVEDSKAVVELGRMLFFDPILSGNQKRACASCHNPDKSFTDGLSKSIAFDFEGTVERNAPTILNASLQSTFFHDGRAGSLEEQAGNVIENKKELKGNFQEISLLLTKSNKYKSLFIKSYGVSDTIVTAYKIKKAIACYERSLVLMNSPFDLYIAGNKSKMTSSQIKGFNLFMGKAQCATCHFPPLFNGMLPPNYKKMETEVIGSTVDNNFTMPVLDNDKGRFSFTHVDLQLHGFKTPTVRNAAATAPYMHNGAFKNMEEVMEFYNKGGGQGLGLNVLNQTLPSKKLDLTSEEIAQVIAFVNSLTDNKKRSVKKPHKLPYVPGVERKVGGEY
jgi:cytochrome c peroxidase